LEHNFALVIKLEVVSGGKFDVNGALNFKVFGTNYQRTVARGEYFSNTSLRKK